MPLSEHEQRMLDQIESALYAEDPKFASSVRGGTLRTPTTRRRLKGGALFVVGLALLVAGVPLYTSTHPALLIVSVVGFVAMFAGAFVALTGSRVDAKDAAAGSASGPSRSKGSKKPRGGSGSFTSRMEDRFRRRFDG